MFTTSLEIKKISAIPIIPLIYILSMISNNLKNSVLFYFMLIMDPQTTLMLYKQRKLGILWSSCTG